MKNGITALLIMAALASGSLSSHAWSASAAGKATASQPKDPGAAQQTAAPATAGGARVNVNTASVRELAQAMNGVGEKKAQAIISWREQHGPFASLEELKQVPGIGSALVERNLSQLTL